MRHIYPFSNKEGSREFPGIQDALPVKMKNLSKNDFSFPTCKYRKKLVRMLFLNNLGISQVWEFHICSSVVFLAEVSVNTKSDANFPKNIVVVVYGRLHWSANQYENVPLLCRPHSWVPAPHHRRLLIFGWTWTMNHLRCTWTMLQCGMLPSQILMSKVFTKKVGMT